MENQPRPRVSACLISYNQAAYLAQALESALGQQVDFPLEVVLADDASTDGSGAIIAEFQKRFPSRLRVLQAQANAGPARTFMKLLAAARGDYVAYLECDDYWTRIDKLQRQFDFMENHPDFSICFHNSDEVSDAPGVAPFRYCPDNWRTVFELKDLFERNFIPSCSVFFRNYLHGVFPDWYAGLPLGDWTLHMLNAQHGKIGYIPEVMGVHRLHQHGTWTRRGLVQQLWFMVEARRTMDAHFRRRFHDELMDWNAVSLESIAHAHMMDGQPTQAARAAAMAAATRASERLGFSLRLARGLVARSPAVVRTRALIHRGRDAIGRWR